jgi:hypothetical protein
MSQAFFQALIKYRGPVPSIALRKRNEIFKAGYLYLLLYWHEHFREKHFTHAGAREYGYTPRVGEAGSGRKFAGSYTERKLKKHGHTRPLEFSGETRRRAAQTPNVRATSKSARLRLDVPALNFKHPKSKVLARSEMIRISPAEQVILAREFEEFVVGAFNRLPDTEQTTI